MTTVFLARHGETVWHEENRYAGVTDIDLTELGRQQAEALGIWAAGSRLDAIYSSTLTRAKETASPAVATTGLALRVDAGFREVDFGEGEGLTIAEMVQAFPAAVEGFRLSPASRAFPGAETGREAVRRALPRLAAIARQHESGRVLIVMHSTLLRLLICELIGIDLDRYRTVFPKVDNCSINQLKINGVDFSLTRMIRFNAALR